jgi:serine/threonine-protein kinase
MPVYDDDDSSVDEHSATEVRDPATVVRAPVFSPRGRQKTQVLPETVVRRDTVKQSRFTHSITPPGIVGALDVPVTDGGFESRYVTESLLGTGGMGQVTNCHDTRVGRQVAMKVLLSDLRGHRSARARFEREARLQGQLEHPSIVPVYDVGVTPDGASYFTMRRLRGMTLEEVLHRLREGDPDLTERYTRRRLLVAFVSLCFAVAYAHDRGVLHRDLKPGNVMLGEYGEVYLLDWGLAKISRPGETHTPPSQTQLHGLSLEDATATGFVLGTPGYMAPEQVRGDIDSLDARTDVFALGAILFEILTLRPLFAFNSVESVLEATMRGADARTSTRVPGANVPLELEHICVRATATNQEDRFASARALCAEIERFLDGERDLTARRKLADEHARYAADAAHASLLPTTTGNDAAQRALREASAALTLDPTNAGALQTIARLLVDIPETIPEEAKPDLERQNQRGRVAAARATASVYLACILLIPGTLALGVRSWPAFLGAVITGLLGLCVALLTARGLLGRAGNMIAYVLGVITITFASTLAGWAIMIPGMTATHTLGAFLFGEKRLRPWFLSLGLIPILLPFLLQTIGVLPASYSFETSQLVVHPLMTDLPGHTNVMLVATSILMLVAPALLLARVKDTLTRAEERLFLHAWMLRRILPAPVGAAVEPTSSR